MDSTLISTTNTFRAKKGETLQSYAVNFTVVVLYLCIGEYSISAVSSHYYGTSEGFWQAHYSTSQPHPTTIPPTHPPKFLFSLPDRPVNIRYQKLKPLTADYTSDKFPILDESKVESASIGADIGRVLQGKPAVTGLMCSCHCVVTWYNMKWYWTTPVWH